VKVIQLPFCYHPDPPGGTEVYVEALARELRHRGGNVVIAAPGPHNNTGEHNGTRVRHFQLREAIADPSELYGEGDGDAAREFERVLDEETPDLIHLHAFTRGVSLRIVRAAKRRGLPVFFTYHTPTVTCLRGTLMRWGAEICEGAMAQSACAACFLHGKGVKRTLAKMVGSFSPASSALLGRLGSGGAWTALRAPEFVHLRHRCVRSLFQEVDRVIAVCEWVKALLILNEVPESKITLSRQGLAQSGGGHPSTDLRGPSPGAPLRVAFLGRLDPTKGVDVLLRAVRSLPGANLALDVYGIAQGEAGERYAATLRQLAAGDPRVTFHQPLPAARVVEALRGYDLLAVPSQWLESGPLVVLEAFAAGIPVMGSRLGGVAELVEHEVNGLLIQADDVTAWAVAFERCLREPSLMETLRRGIRAPRTMATVADEMLALYSDTIKSPALQPA